MAQSHLKLFLIFVIFVFVPLSITITTAVLAYYLKRDHLACRITRDISQAIYLSVTFLGLTRYETGIRFIRNRLSLDVVCVVFLSVSCFIMSLTSLQKILPNGLLIVLEIIANVSGSVYIGMLYARYGNYR